MRLLSILSEDNFYCLKVFCSTIRDISDLKRKYFLNTCQLRVLNLGNIKKETLTHLFYLEFPVEFRMMVIHLDFLLFISQYSLVMKATRFECLY